MGLSYLRAKYDIEVRCVFFIYVFHNIFTYSLCCSFNFLGDVVPQLVKCSGFIFTDLHFEYFHRKNLELLNQANEKLDQAQLPLSDWFW